MGKRTRGKGFNRSSKEWEETAASHLGKFVDRLKVQDIFDAFVNLGVGYYGYKATNDWTGALTALVGLKLAQAPAGTIPLSQGAGLAILGGLGLANLGNWLGLEEGETPTDPVDLLKGSVRKGWELGEDVFGKPTDQQKYESQTAFAESGVTSALAITGGGYGGFGEGSLYAYRQSVREATGVSGHP